MVVEGLLEAYWQHKYNSTFFWWSGTKFTYLGMLGPKKGFAYIMSEGNVMLMLDGSLEVSIIKLKKVEKKLKF